MFDYFLTNISISCIALCVLIILKDSPARLRFYVAMTTLLTWFIPWNLIAAVPLMSESINPLTDDVFNSLLWLESQQSTLVENAVNAGAKVNNTSLDSIGYALYGKLVDGTLFILLSIMGLLFFIKDMFEYHINLKHWNNNSQEDNSLWEIHGFQNHNISIRILEGFGPGMATGPIKPTIWLNKDYQSANTSKTILTHELNHIQQHDPCWMWLITFTQRCFWWNPLVRLLTGIAREQIELSCDEKCRQQLHERYASDLAQILLSSTPTSTNYIAAISIKNGSNFNITRMKKLTKESKMKTKHLITLMVGFSMVGFVGAAVSYDKHAPVQNKTAEASTSHKSAKIKLHRSEDKHGSALHNELVDELLQLSQKAKSNDPETINQILLDIEKWNVSRRAGPDKRSESSLKINSFTMMAYLLGKLGRYDEIPSTYDTLYPNTPITEQLFLKHHLALAYIKMGLPEKAIDLMVDVTQRQPSPKTGSLMLIAYANLAAANYNEVITTADELLKFSIRDPSRIIALNYKSAAYMAMGNTKKADKINHTLEEAYSVKNSYPFIPGMATPLLSYLPEA